ncbi:hypothetical protein V5799_000055 [Amblyomma americanum]|uniref:Peptidase M13 N-terminal domain-containing protein n=1 Tax=Amblyomma americanum TaxID=6943 RepID=A0AAQ4D455_AMBAM
MTDKPVIKNQSLESSKGPSVTASKHRHSVTEKIPTGGGHSRHRQRPDRRRSSRNIEIQETEFRPNDDRGQTSDSHRIAEVTAGARRDGACDPPSSRQTPRPDAEAPGTGTSGTHTRAHHDRGQTSGSSRPAEGSAVVVPDAKCDGSSLSPCARQTTRPDAEAPGTGTSGTHTRAHHDRGQTSGSSRPAGGSAVVVPDAKCDVSSVSPYARQTPRPDAEAPGTGTSGTHTRAHHDRGQTSGSSRPAGGSAVVVPDAKSDGSSVSPGARQTPRPDAEAPGTGTPGTHTRDHHDKGQMSISSSPTEDSAVVMTSANSDGASLSPGSRQTTRLDAESSGAGTSDVGARARHDKGQTSDLPRLAEASAGVTTAAESDGNFASPGVKPMPQPDVNSPGTDKTDIRAGTRDGKIPAPESPLPAEGTSMITASATKEGSFVSAVGGATLREFVPLTTITEKLSQSAVIYGSLGGFVGLACVALVLMMWATDPSHQRSECSSAECRDARAFLDSLLDQSIQPCSDFYLHVCRRWRVDHFDGATLAQNAARDLIGSLDVTLLETARRHGTCETAFSSQIKHINLDDVS